MRKLGFIIAVRPTNAFLVHNKIKVKCQGGDAEQLTNAKFIRTLTNEIVENEKWNKKKSK